MNLFFINQLWESYKSQIQTDTNRIYIQSFDKDLFEEKYNQLAKLIIMWEGILIISTMLLFYLVIEKYIRKEREYKEFLELMILTVSHKFGNFLATLKINLDIIKSSCNLKAIENSENYTNELSKDLQLLIKLLKSSSSEEPEDIDIKELILDTMKNFGTGNRKVIVEITDFRVTARKDIIENILFILIDNCFKYSKSFIHIRTFKGKVIVLRNDVRKREGGSGIGLTIAEKFCQLNGWTLKKIVRKDYFTVFLKF
ncbi:MAG: hypothetical protein N2Z81_07840 [Hydrogenothermaceae bacterium]|nr:hypothetical protein [Hydrogenothermaceae bacterium]